MSLDFTLCPTGTKGPWYRASHKEVSLVYFSWARLSPLIWLHHAAGWSVLALWLGQQPSPALLLHLPCSKRALIPWQQWIRASSEAIVTPLFHTASRTICFLEATLPTRSGTGAMAACSSRWTSGRGATAWAAPWPGWCPLQRLRGSGASISARAGSGQERLGSDTARLLLLQGLQRGRAQWSTSHDIISDVIYNIIPYVYMISYMILKFDFKEHKLWYQIWYHKAISYDLGYSCNPYDIMVDFLISCMISCMIS